ncbi:hypothetical protein [Hymenobacter edaphi]|uniref:hypothetical protein n=1 Tax=Hymenobacter edaphi TaxID=2211146 RepID=UPI001A9F74A1|nr:hypothetical protein [Hymenobacter edaphi]
MTTLNKLPMARLYASNNIQNERQFAQVINDHLKKHHDYTINDIIDKCFQMRNLRDEIYNFDYNQMRAAVLKTLITDKIPGFKWEKKAQKLLQITFPTIEICYDAQTDEQDAIDFFLCHPKTKESFYGIQVKSKRFKHFSKSREAMKKAEEKHEAYKQKHNIPVSFLYYGKHHFENGPEVISKIHKELESKNNYYNYFNPDFVTGFKQ